MTRPALKATIVYLTNGPTISASLPIGKSAELKDMQAIDSSIAFASAVATTSTSYPLTERYNFLQTLGVPIAGEASLKAALRNIKQSSYDARIAKLCREPDIACEEWDALD